MHVERLRLLRSEGWSRVDTSTQNVEIPVEVARALILLDDGGGVGVKAAAEACGIARTTLARWRKRRDKDEAVRQAFLATKSDIRAQERQARVDRVLDHLSRGGGLLELADELGVSRSTLYLDLKEMGGFERMRELRDELAVASSVQALALKEQAAALLASRLPRWAEIAEDPSESATVRGAMASVVQKVAAHEPSGAKTSVSVTNNVVAAAQAGVAVGEAEPPVVDIEALGDDELHQLADALVEFGP